MILELLELEGRANVREDRQVSLLDDEEKVSLEALARNKHFNPDPKSKLVNTYFGSEETLSDNFTKKTQVDI